MTRARDRSRSIAPTVGGACPSFDEAVARASALCSRAGLQLVEVATCEGVFRSVRWRYFVLGGGDQYFDASGRLTAAYLTTDYNAYCGHSFTQTFGDDPRVSGPGGDDVPLPAITRADHAAAVDGPAAPSYTAAMELRGASALVTGAGRGIGRAIAVALGGAGASVTVVSRTPKRARGDGARGGAGGRPRGVHAADVRKRADCEAAIARAVEAHGGLQILVNNAGIGSHGRDRGDQRRAVERRAGDQRRRRLPPDPRRAPPPREAGRPRLHDLVAGGQERHRGHGRVLREQGRARPLRRVPDARGALRRHQGDHHRPRLRRHELRAANPDKPAARAGCSPRRTWPRMVVDVASARDAALHSRVEMRPLRPQKRA